MKIHYKLAERFAHHVVALREKQKLPRAALAATMGIHEQYLYQLETERKTPSLEVVELAARALDVDPTALLKEVKP